MISQEETQAKTGRINLPILFLTNFVFITIGFLPVALLLDRIWVSYSLGLVGAFFFVLSIRGFRPKVPYSPSFTEYMMLGFEMIFFPAATGLFWMLAYFILYGLIWGINYLLGFFDLHLVWNIGSTAFWITFPIATLTYITIEYFDAETSINKLCPETAGLRSAYYPLYTQNQTGFIIGVITFLLLLIVPTVVVVVYTSWNPVYLYIYLEIILFIGGTASIATDTSETQTTQDQVSAVAKLYKTAGFEVEERPRTQDPKVDPLLKDLDLAASKSNDNYFVQVISSSESEEEIDYNSLLTLTESSFTLSEQRDINLDTIKKQIVLIDKPASDRLKQVSSNLGIDVVELNSDILNETINYDPTDIKSQQSAKRLLENSIRQSSQRNDTTA